MLVIRLQRTGRKGHAQFRVVVQDSRRTPTSGKIVAHLGHFNPHSKEVVIDKEKVALYLKNGAQPSDRVVRLLKSEGVKLPSWVKDADKKERKLRNPDKLRRNRPEEPEAPKEEAPEVTEEVPTEEPAEAKTEESTDAVEAVETPEVAEETVAEEVAETTEPKAAPEAPEETTEEVAVEEASEPETAEKSEEPVAEDTDKKEEA